MKILSGWRSMNSKDSSTKFQCSKSIHNNTLCLKLSNTIEMGSVFSS